jgi:hypothetical protein
VNGWDDGSYWAADFLLGSLRFTAFVLFGRRLMGVDWGRGCFSTVHVMDGVLGYGFP